MFRGTNMSVTLNWISFQNDKLRYDFVTNEAGVAAAQAFWLNPENGVIMAFSPLTEAGQTRYQFSVQARDQSDPEKTTSTNVQITISRDEYPPTTTRPSYSRTIDENEKVNGSSLLRIVASDPDLKVNHL